CAPLERVDAARVRMRWLSAAAGEHYQGRRWRSERRRRRDPELVAALLERHLPAQVETLLLDAPCGAGRLSATLAQRGRTIGVDLSPSMRAAARRAGAGAQGLLLGDVAALPFRNSAFDAVVCCRLLHHLSEPGAFQGVLAELVRVSRRLVIASFWD